MIQPNVVMHAYNPSTLEAETGRLWTTGQSELHSKPCLKNKIKESNDLIQITSTSSVDFYWLILTSSSATVYMTKSLGCTQLQEVENPSVAHQINLEQLT
jgi:hypothetical protein